MNIGVNIKKKWLTIKARRLYYRLNSLYGCVDCGTSLLEYMHPAARHDRKKLLAIYRLLKRYQNQIGGTFSTGPR